MKAAVHIMYLCCIVVLIVLLTRQRIVINEQQRGLVYQDSVQWNLLNQREVDSLIIQELSVYKDSVTTAIILKAAQTIN